MVVADAEIERLAREMIATHGRRAAPMATERLNEMIDRNNSPGRDVWACVVHAIHARQGSGPVFAGWPHDWRSSAPRLETAISL
jgi:hypothetical protein